jgi:hypothetical protein
MAKIIPITEHYQHFLAEMKESFWGDLYDHTKLAWKQALEAESEGERDRFAGREFYQRRSQRRQPYRNGYYERDFVTRMGTIRLRIARTRGKSFLPRALEPFQRRAEDVAMLIREAFLRGISTRQVGRVVATLTDEVVSAQTVSKLTRDLDEAVKQFHQARLSDDYAYLFLDGVSLRVRRPAGRKRVHMLVAYGVRRDGTRHLLAFLRSQGESQADWEGLLGDLYRRGLEGTQLGLIVADGCAGPGGGHSHRLSPGAASALLGAQDAQYSRESAEARLRRSEDRGPGDLSGREPRQRRSRVPPLPGALAAGVRPHGPPPWARSPGTALGVRLPPASVAETAHHQCHRALLRRSAAPELVPWCAL